MNSVGFIRLPNGFKFTTIEPAQWDRQTMVVLSDRRRIGSIKEVIRMRYKPTSHSEGHGYDIDVYTNLNYRKDEKDPAMRNIRCVYCDYGIMTMESINKRFPNSYIVVDGLMEGGVQYDVQYGSQQISGEVPQIPRH